MNLLAQLAFLNEKLSDKEKISELIRCLPESIALFAMVAKLLVSFEKVEESIRAEFDRRKDPYNQ